jgi:hypothetical protein
MRKVDNYLRNEHGDRQNNDCNSLQNRVQRHFIWVPTSTHGGSCLLCELLALLYEITLPLS